MQATKRPFEHKVIVRKTDFRIPWSGETEKPGAIHEIYAGLVNDENRNRLIVEDVLDVVAKKRFPVILTERSAGLVLHGSRIF